MEVAMKAIEITGKIDEQGQLQLDGTLDHVTPGPVRVILLFPQAIDSDEREWLRAAARNQAFDFLKDDREDIYSITDGKPFRDEG